MGDLPSVTKSKALTKLGVYVQCFITNDKTLHIYVRVDILQSCMASWQSCNTEDHGVVLIGIYYKGFQIIRLFER